MDSHGNIIFRAHLGAQVDPRLLVIDDPDPHLLVAAFYEPCLLPVFIVGRSRLIAKLQRPFQRYSRAHHIKPPDADRVGALHPC